MAETVRKPRTFLGRREAPCRTAIKKLVGNFELLVILAENIAVVAENVEENPGFSISRRSLELGIPQTSLHRILHKDLGLKAYKVQLTQELKLADHQQRGVFADWVVEIHENDPLITIGHRDLVI